MDQAVHINNLNIDTNEEIIKTKLEDMIATSEASWQPEFISSFKKDEDFNRIVCNACIQRLNILYLISLYRNEGVV